MIRFDGNCASGKEPTGSTVGKNEGRSTKGGSGHGVGGGALTVELGEF